MDLTSWMLLSSAVASAVIAFWRQFAVLSQWVKSAMFETLTISGPAAHDVYTWLKQHGKIASFSDRFFQSDDVFIRPLGAVGNVVFEFPPSSPRLVFLPKTYAKWPSVITVRSGSDKNSASDGVINSHLIFLTCVRSSCDLSEIVRVALAWAVSLRVCSRRYQVYKLYGTIGLQANTPGPQHAGRGSEPSVSHFSIRSFLCVHWRPEDIGAAIPVKPFSSYVLSESAAAARADFSRWLALRNWYAERDIPWRRGHLYVGRPGTGKTSLARALAQEAGLPVFLLDLPSMSNRDLNTSWDTALESTPCVVVIEDIDAVFNLRQNVTGVDNSVTFDCLLNTIGGISACDGVFLVITSNHPEKVDAAIAGSGEVSRPGRIDRVFHLEQDPEVSKKIVIKIAGADADLSAVENMSQAAATEYAIQLATRKLFDDRAELS